MAIGVCWPGVIREDKIAGASGILKYFDPESVASKWIRENTVDGIRQLDLESDLSAALKRKYPQGASLPTLGICNDGYAEALGRLVEESHLRKRRWGILKLGTGTAGAVLDRGSIRDGVQEFGKLVLNVYQSSSTAFTVDPNHLPQGDLNSYVSQNLFPAVLREMCSVPSECDISSHDIGRTGELVLQETPENDAHRMTAPSTSGSRPCTRLVCRMYAARTS